MLQPGKLRHRLTLEEPLQTQNATTGEITTSWLEVAKVWAAIEPLSVREFTASASEVSKITTRITIRYRAGVTDEMRLYDASKDVYYDIHGVLSDKNSGMEYLSLPCSTGVKYK